MTAPALADNNLGNARNPRLRRTHNIWREMLGERACTVWFGREGGGGGGDREEDRRTRFEEIIDEYKKMQKKEMKKMTERYKATRIE